jgi:hypothetical protein
MGSNELVATALSINQADFFGDSAFCGSPVEP